MNHALELRKLVFDRQSAFVYEKVFDEDLGKEFEELTAESSKDVDRRAYEIRCFIRDHREHLAVDQMIEAITMLGGAPSVLYDDNGYFTIGSDGSQPLSPTLNEGFETKETEFSGMWWVKPGAWKETIREALYFYIDEMFADDVYANPET